MSNAKEYKYRNKTANELTLMGVGVVKAGGTVTVSEPISNPNFELVDEGVKSKSQERREAAIKGSK